jgi:hypothetical protein
MRPSIDGFWIDGFVCACGALAATTSVSESWGARRGNKKPAKAWLSAGFVFGVVAPRAGLEPATERLTAVCSTTELPGINTLQSDISELGRNAKMKLLALPRFGGHARNRTGVHGFAGRCVTTPPRGRNVQTLRGELVFINICLGSATCFSLTQMFCEIACSVIVKSSATPYIVCI